MLGETLFVGIGTGLDIAHFPHGPAITAIDISSDMLDRAQPRRRRYLEGTPHEGRAVLRLELQDAAALPYADAHFDTVATACTLCSVPDADVVLRQILRVLRPGGRLLLFEHVRSAHPLLGAVLDVMSLWSRRSGTDMSRDTLASVIAAGFVIERVEASFLDIILAVEASRPEVQSDEVISQ
ncbi:MAG: class I SAM-dependent methyltransferase [Vicinamibacteria bacterium]